jgi:hypothetical protein
MYWVVVLVALAQNGTSFTPSLRKPFQAQGDCSMIQSEASVHSIELTGIKRSIPWPSSRVVHDKAEQALERSRVLLKRGEYCDGEHLSAKRIHEIEAECKYLEMSLEQGLSLRKQALVTKIVTKNSGLQRHLSYLSREFKRGRGIMQLSMETDLPSMSIIRAILTRRVKSRHPGWIDKDVKKLVRDTIAAGHGCYLKNEGEQQQLALAKKYDQTSYADSLTNGEEKQAATGWEVSLLDYLDKHEISYLTEETLSEMASATTPDVLLLDDVTIQGRRVRWIDSKNYFGGVVGGGGGHFIKKLTKQINKYDGQFEAPGAIVYRLGYSQALQRKLGHSTLLLDQGPLQDPL